MSSPFSNNQYQSFFPSFEFEESHSFPFAPNSPIIYQATFVCDSEQSAPAFRIRSQTTDAEKASKNRNGGSSLTCVKSSLDAVEGCGGNGKRRKNLNNNGGKGVGMKEKLAEKKLDNQKESSNGCIHVKRARRGHATDSHSLAERVRREKISERMKILQALVPGCDKVTGKALMLDEIINYVQSLQNQVEFLSMKLASVNPVLFDDSEIDPDVYIDGSEIMVTQTPQSENMRLCNNTAPQTTTAVAVGLEENSFVVPFHNLNTSPGLNLIDQQEEEQVSPSSQHLISYSSKVGEWEING